MISRQECRKKTLSMQIAFNPFSDHRLLHVLVLLHIKCTNISLLIIDDSRGNSQSQTIQLFFQNDIDTLHNHLFYHSLEIRGLGLTKFSCKTLQNLPHFLEYKNPHGSFQFFNLQSFIFSLMNNALVYGNIDQSIHKGFSRSFHKAQAFYF